LRIASATPDRAVRALQGPAVDYLRGQVVVCQQDLAAGSQLGLAVDYPPGLAVVCLQDLAVAYLRVPVVDDPPVPEVDYPLDLAVVCLRAPGAGSRLALATTGDEFRRNKKVHPTTKYLLAG
jgi:hypothetical protein